MSVPGGLCKGRIDLFSHWVGFGSSCVSSNPWTPAGHPYYNTSFELCKYFFDYQGKYFSAAVALITKPVSEMIALVNCCSRQRGHTGYLLSVPVDFKNVQGLPAAIFSVPVNRRSGEHTGMKLRKFNLLTIMVIVIISLRLAFQSLQEGRQHIERPVIQRPLPDQNDSCFGLQSQKKDIKIPSAFLQYFSRHKCAFLQNFD